MNNDNDLMDSLLKEYAKSKGVDERFLHELEVKLDGEDAVLMNRSSDRASSHSNKMGLKLGVGIAACAALCVGGSMLWSNKHAPETIAVNSGAADIQIDAAKEELNSLRNASGSATSSPKKLSENSSKGGVSRSEYSAKGGDGLNDMPKGERAYSQSKSGENQESVPKSSKVKNIPKKKALVNGDIRGHMRSEMDVDRSLVDLNSEKYGQLIENKFTAPVDKESKRSTFAIDVDTASYANVRRMITMGSVVSADSVRVEELVNYFDYQYEKPGLNAKHPFAVHVDAVVCPWNEDNKLVRIALQGKEVFREQRPASNVVFLLDVSGSMNRANKLPLLKDSLKYLLEEMNEKDVISIVVYAGASGVVLPATHVDDAGRAKILQSMEKLSAGGSTAGGAGIKLAYKLAQESFIKGGVNRVILATDGDFNVGVSGTTALTKMVKDRAAQGVDISVLGFGTGNLNDRMLELITNSGNGNYSYIDTIREGRKVLLEDMMGTMMTIAKDVKIQVEFNPERVKEYRLLGYSNRMLPNSAFLDKKADAGEIGVGHRVTAFYEVVPGKAMDKSEMNDLRYAEKLKPREQPRDEGVVADHADELLHVKLAYKQPDQKMHDESTYLSVPFKDDVMSIVQADDDFRFASSVALFGMVLRDSDYCGKGDIDLVLKLAESGKGADGRGLREEFVNLVKKLKGRRER